jgi:hypothetical protein
MITGASLEFRAFRALRVHRCSPRESSHPLWEGFSFALAAGCAVIARAILPIDGDPGGRTERCVRGWSRSATIERGSKEEEWNEDRDIRRDW